MDCLDVWMVSWSGVLFLWHEALVFDFREMLPCTLCTWRREIPMQRISNLCTSIHWPPCLIGLFSLFPFELRGQGRGVFFLAAGLGMSKVRVQFLTSVPRVWMAKLNFKLQACSHEAAKGALVYSYKEGLNGFSAKLTPEQVSALSGNWIFPSLSFQRFLQIMYVEYKFAYALGTWDWFYAESW